MLLSRHMDFCMEPHIEEYSRKDQKIETVNSSKSTSSCVSQDLRLRINPFRASVFITDIPQDPGTGKYFTSLAVWTQNKSQLYIQILVGKGFELCSAEFGDELYLGSLKKIEQQECLTRKKQTLSNLSNLL